MNAMVQAELEEIERTALELGRMPSRLTAAEAQAVDDHSEDFGLVASSALRTLLYLGLITRAEDHAWRERLGSVLGRDLRTRRFRITKAGAEPGDMDPESEASHAYSSCRHQRLTFMARVLHTAATKEAITDAFADGAVDPDLVRAACARGFAERADAD